MPFTNLHFVLKKLNKCLTYNRVLVFCLHRAQIYSHFASLPHDCTVVYFMTSPFQLGALHVWIPNQERCR